MGEPDALLRSQQHFKSTYEGLQKNLEGLSSDMVTDAMTNHDPRFTTIDVDTAYSINLPHAKQAVMSQLQPSDLEISIAGDFDPKFVLDLIYYYLGTISPNVNKQYALHDSTSFGNVPSLPLPPQFVSLELPDSDPRAVAYVSGTAPNVWGYLADGTSISSLLLSKQNLSD